MKVRRLVPADINAFFAIRLRALANAPKAFNTTLEEDQKSGPARFLTTLRDESNTKAIFGAVLDDKIIAILAIFQEERSQTRHKASISSVYVDAEYRRRGLATQLLDRAIQFARKDTKVSAIYLSVESKNTSAISLYESRGFVIWGLEPKAMLREGVFYDQAQMVLLI